MNTSIHINNDIERSIYWFVFILALAIAIRFFVFAGIIGADDVAIAMDAIRLLEQGPWLPEGHYSARVGLIYPLAGIYALFGVGETQTVAIPFIASVLNVVLTYLIGKQLFNHATGLLAAAILAIFPLDAMYASILVPDLPLGTALAAAFYFLVRSFDENKSDVWAIIAGLSWGLGYLIKIEAAFFGLPLILLLLAHWRGWRQVAIACITVASVVAIESIIYWLAGGELIHRIYAITHSSQSVAQVTSEYSATQLWVFPKAWFVTFYQFGLHYYFLFAALIWTFLAKNKWAYVLAGWVVIYLLWLQFGGNPFAENYSVKSHLLRYCAMTNVPMALLVAAFMASIFSWRKNVGKLCTFGIFATGLFLINFNLLSVERATATKMALDHVVANELCPVYMDRTSNELARVYAYHHYDKCQMQSYQAHDFETHDTRILDFSALDGYVILNRGFMDYSWNRYRVDKTSLDQLVATYDIVMQVDNPMNFLAYQQTLLLMELAELLPGDYLRQKIKVTAQALLKKTDAVVVRLR